MAAMLDPATARPHVIARMLAIIARHGKYPGDELLPPGDGVVKFTALSGVERRVMLAL
jgi:hypothetical protein